MIYFYKRGKIKEKSTKKCYTTAKEVYYSYKGTLREGTLCGEGKLCANQKLLTEGRFFKEN